MKTNQRGLRRKFVLASGISGLLLLGVGPQPAKADVIEVRGSAYGAYVRVSLFGGPANQVGPAPVVELPAAGGNERQSQPSLIAQFGPATVFGGKYEEPGNNPSGELTVSTDGRTGPNGFVTTTASVVNIGPGPLIADAMSSTCTANEGGVAASTKVTNGIAETSYNPDTQEPATMESVPENPEPNTVFEGTIDHVGDHFRIVFNEQIVDGGTMTVRAAHMYLLGPIAVGDSIIAESVCAVSGDGVAAPPPPDTPAPGTVPTTEPDASPVPTTEAPAAETSVPRDDDDGEINAAEAARSRASDDDGGNAGLVIGALAAVGVLGLAGLFAYKRRGAQPGE